MSSGAKGSSNVAVRVAIIVDGSHYLSSQSEYCGLFNFAEDFKAFSSQLCQLITKTLPGRSILWELTDFFHTTIDGKPQRLHRALQNMCIRVELSTFKARKGWLVDEKMTLNKPQLKKGESKQACIQVDGGVHVALAVRIMMRAMGHETSRVDKMFIITGESDLIPALEEAERCMGRGNVILIGSRHRVSNELRRYCMMNPNLASSSIGPCSESIVFLEDIFEVSIPRKLISSHYLQSGEMETKFTERISCNISHDDQPASGGVCKECGFEEDGTLRCTHIGSDCVTDNNPIRKSPDTHKKPLTTTNPAEKNGIEMTSTETINSYDKYEICYKCFETGHIADTCTTVMSQLRCTRCGEFGHATTNCVVSSSRRCGICRFHGHSTADCKYVQSGLSKSKPIPIMEEKNLITQKIPCNANLSGISNDKPGTIYLRNGGYEHSEYKSPDIVIHHIPDIVKELNQNNDQSEGTSRSDAGIDTETEEDGTVTDDGGADDDAESLYTSVSGYVKRAFSLCCSDSERETMESALKIKLTSLASDSISLSDRDWNIEPLPRLQDDLYSAGTNIETSTSRKRNAGEIYQENDLIPLKDCPISVPFKRFHPEIPPPKLESSAESIEDLALRHNNSLSEKEKLNMQCAEIFMDKGVETFALSDGKKNSDRLKKTRIISGVEIKSRRGGRTEENKTMSPGNIRGALNVHENDIRNKMKYGKNTLCYHCGKPGHLRDRCRKFQSRLRERRDRSHFLSSCNHSGQREQRGQNATSESWSPRSIPINAPTRYGDYSYKCKQNGEQKLHKQSCQQASDKRNGVTHRSPIKFNYRDVDMAPKKIVPGISGCWQPPVHPTGEFQANISPEGVKISRDAK